VVAQETRQSVIQLQNPENVDVQQMLIAALSPARQSVIQLQKKNVLNASPLQGNKDLVPQINSVKLIRPVQMRHVKLITVVAQETRQSVIQLQNPENVDVQQMLIAALSPARQSVIQLQKNVLNASPLMSKELVPQINSVRIRPVQMRYVKLITLVAQETRQSVIHLQNPENVLHALLLMIVRQVVEHVEVTKPAQNH